MTISEIFLQILSLAYAFVGVISIIAYWPTIVDLYYHKKQSANISSYILWTFTTGVAFLYAMFSVKDGLFMFVSGMNFVACAVIWFLSVGLRNRQIN